MGAPPSRVGMFGSTIGPVQPRNLKKFQFSTGELVLEQALPYIVIVNNDTIAHTITAKGLNKQDSDVVFPVPALGTISIPTLPFLSLVSDGAGTLTSLYAFYADVLIQGPRPAAGSGFAASAKFGYPDGLSPSTITGQTEEMNGMGSTVTFTPALTGIVSIWWFGAVQLGDSAQPVTSEWSRLRAYSGTGAAPANGAGATGTAGPHYDVRWVQSGATENTAVFPFSFIDRLALTAGTAYWFDISSKSVVSATGQTSLTAYAYISEDPS